MSERRSNFAMHRAKSNPNDEFYTCATDIEAELKHYKKHFEGKAVYCNCDDPETSEFFKFFQRKFEDWGLKCLVGTSYSTDPNEPGRWLLYEGDINGNGVPDPEETRSEPMLGNGDFRSQECVELLQQMDIVVTNPPFSLFREYLAQLIKYDKKFLIIGSVNAITYKEVFPLIMENRLWLGHGFKAGNAYFRVSPERGAIFARGVYAPLTGLAKFRNVCWFTNLDHDKRHEELILFRQYAGHEDEYPTYDNYDAIEVSRVANIPEDYWGVMGVPITFLDKYNPDQFEIVGSFNAGAHGKEVGATKVSITVSGKPLMWNGPVVAGKPLYKRLIIRRRR